MHHRAHAVIAQRRADVGIVLDFALYKRGARVDQPVEPGRQIVIHHDAVARIEQCQHRMAADIARAARYQYRSVQHAYLPFLSRVRVPILKP